MAAGKFDRLFKSIFDDNYGFVSTKIFSRDRALT